MKRFFLMALVVFTFMVANAETRVVTLNSNISCDRCAKTIKENIRFEKGVKKIEVDIEKKTVKITYEGKKNKAENLMEAVSKLGYKSIVVSDEEVQKKK